MVINTHMCQQDGTNIGDITYPNHFHMSEAASNPDWTDFWYITDEIGAEGARYCDWIDTDIYNCIFE